MKNNPYLMAAKNFEFGMFRGAVTAFVASRFLVSAVVTVVYAGLILTLTSCSSSLGSGGRGSKYQYQFKMVAPTPSNEMLYQDDSLIIQFRFDQAAVKFQLQNLSESDIIIDWESSSIGVDNLFHPVRHSVDFYGESTLKIKGGGVIPPLGYIRELIIPRDNIYPSGEKWTEVDLLPTTDKNNQTLKKSILQSVGRSVSVILPMKFGQATKKYRFDFAVASVNSLAWAQYAPPKRNPPPSRPKQASKPDYLTTGIIVTSIVGFSAYLLTRKKDPATE